MNEEQNLIKITENFMGIAMTKTGKELYDHSARVKESVLEKFGVELVREVNVITSP